MTILVQGINKETRANTILEINQSAPVVVTDTIRTSEAAIFSESIEDDKSAELAEIMATKKNVIIDTPIALNSEVFATVNGQHITGTPTGVLLVGPDMANSTALRIAGNNSIISALNMDNPLLIADKTIKTTRQGAIGIEAHNVTVRNSLITKMLHGIYVMSSGEWDGTLIDGNYVLDCIGAGMGPDDIESGWGEDKGDGITVWGSSARVVNNFVSAMAGQDCRVAFHAEGLPGSHASNNPATDEANFIYANNHAIGTFRRHFVFEDVKRGIMSGNISAGGATWWALALIQTADVLVDGMIMKITRNANENQGGHWNPQRAAIGLVNYSERCKIKNVRATWEADAAMGAFISTLKAAEGHPAHSQFTLEDSEFHMNPASLARGVDITALTSPTIRNVDIYDCDQPVYGWRPKGKVVIDGLKATRFKRPLYVEGNYQGSVEVVNSRFNNTDATNGAQTAVNIIQTGRVAIKRTDIEGLNSLAAIGDISGSTTKISYLKDLAVMGCESVGQQANVRIDNKTEAEVAATVNMVGNVGITGSFTTKPAAE